jgi:hypothetical protein
MSNKPFVILAPDVVAPSHGYGRVGRFSTAGKTSLQPTPLSPVFIEDRVSGAVMVPVAQIHAPAADEIQAVFCVGRALQPVFRDCRKRCRADVRVPSIWTTPHPLLAARDAPHVHTLALLVATPYAANEIT